MRAVQDGNRRKVLLPEADPPSTTDCASRSRSPMCRGRSSRTKSWSWLWTAEQPPSGPSGATPA